MSERIDWPQLMRLGLGALRLPPPAFWEMTPPELLAALEGAGLAAPEGGAATMTRTGLAALMARFPDQGHGRKPDAEL